MRTAERNQVPWEPITGDCLAGAHAESSASQNGQLRQYQFRRLGTCEHSPCLHQEERTGFGQFDASSDAMEQLRAMARLKSGDSCANSRLRHMKGLSCTCNVLPFGNRHEYTELLQGH